MNRIHIIIDEEEERRQRLKPFNKVIELYCANLKERTTHTPMENHMGGDLRQNKKEDKK